VLDCADRPSRPDRERVPVRQPSFDWVMAALIVVVLVLLGALGVLLYAQGRIMPEVRVLDVNVGGLTRRQAVAALQDHWAGRVVLLRASDRALLVRVSELGLMLDAGSTVEAAYRQSRTTQHLSAVLGGGGPLYIAPTVLVDAAAAESYLGSVASEFDSPARDAQVRLERGRAEALPPMPGRALDVGMTVEQVTAHAAEIVASGKVEAAIVAVEPAVRDASALADEINAWFGHTFTVHAYDPVRDETWQWVAPPGVWMEWVSVDVQNVASAQWQWTLDLTSVRRFLEAHSANLDADQYILMDDVVSRVAQAFDVDEWDVHTRVYHHPSRHTVQAGETIASIARDYGIPYPWIQAANPGVGDALRVGQALVIPSPDVLLPLPVVENKRIVVSISGQSMRAYENGAVVWAWPVSTGIASSPTAPGVFQILSHEENAYAASWDLWMPYFLGIYRPVPSSQFMNGFHGFPTRDGTSLLWTSSLGHPVTFGCILLSTPNAATLYEWAEDGVIVHVQP